MHVEDLMTKDVGSCCLEDRLRAAVAIMQARDRGCVPVVSSPESNTRGPMSNEGHNDMPRMAS